MLKGKTALVTGSTSGIGLGMAKALAGQGANIVVNGFGEPAAIAAVEKDIQALGVKTLYHGADMSKPEQIEALVRAAESTFGRIDILVNNAGIQHVAPVESFPVERWDAIIAINLTSAFHTTRLALPKMRASGWGRIINVASVHGLVASAEKSAYVAAKHGIVGFTKTIALETARTGVTVNAVCPGWVLTPLVQTAGRCASSSRQDQPGRCQAGPARREAAIHGLRNVRATGRTDALSLLAGGRPDSWSGIQRRRRLVRAIDGDPRPPDHTFKRRARRPA